MSLIPNTFDGLVSAIISLAEDDSQEFLDYVPTAIFLAEERLNKEVEKQGVHTTGIVSATGGIPFITKPEGYRFAYGLAVIDTSGSSTQPRRTTRQFLVDYWPNQSLLDRPKYYTDYGSDQFILAPTPDVNYNILLEYNAGVAHISASGQTSWYTSNCPDVLFYSTMCNMCEFMKDYSTMKQWETKYQDGVKTLNNEGRRERRDANPPESKANGQNTLDGGN